jgi:hypothetical protein
MMHRDKHDTVSIERLLAVPELPASWQRTLEKRLSGGHKKGRVPTRRTRRLKDWQKKLSDYLYSLWVRAM